MPDARSRLLAAAAWTLLGLLTVALVQLALTLPGGPDELSDPRVYRAAVAELARGGSLYAYVAPNGDQFIYPPFAGLVLVPLTAYLWRCSAWSPRWVTSVSPCCSPTWC